MGANYNRNTHDIYTHQEPNREETSPFSPQSPDRKASPVQPSKRNTFTKGAVAGAAFVGARRVGSSMLQEYENMTGDKQTVQQINNIATGMSMGAVIVATKGAAIPMYAVTGALETFAAHRSRQRQDAKSEFERKSMGARLNPRKTGGAYYG